MAPERTGHISAPMRRFDSVEEFASLEEGDLRMLAVDASRFAIASSGIDERDALEALRKVELGQDDADAAASMNALAGRLDQRSVEPRGGWRRGFDTTRCSDGRGP